MVVCNRDCLNCPYPDVPAECLDAPLTADDYRQLEEIEEIINPKTAQQRKVAAQQRAWYEANKDKVAARQRARYEANKDKVAAQQSCIAQIRKARGMTQAQLAALIGVARSTISAFERGRLVADWDKLCDALPELNKYRP